MNELDAVLWTNTELYLYMVSLSRWEFAHSYKALVRWAPLRVGYVDAWFRDTIKILKKERLL